MWIARDKNGTLCAYKDKPLYDKYDGEWYVHNIVPGKVTCIDLDSSEFSEITCENSPVQIISTLNATCNR